MGYLPRIYAKSGSTKGANRITGLALEFIIIRFLIELTIILTLAL